MRRLQNILYITMPLVYLSLDGENIVLLKDKDIIARVPLHNLEGIVTFGYKGISPALMGACVERGIGISFLSQGGRFLARVNGPVNGNVLLRVKQYEWANDPAKSLALSKMFITGKIYNCRWSLERTKRDHAQRIDVKRLTDVIEQQKNALRMIDTATNLDELRGIEGSAAKEYFGVFGEMILRNEDTFQFSGRNRRPPLDPVNAMLSFAYTLLGNEICGALESVGLDPAVGFCHSLRPGRSSLALDMIEEMRAPYADRFVLSMINLGKMTKKDFTEKENGAVILKEDSRREFLAAWQNKKQELITHPFLKEKIEWGLVPYVQAKLLARYLRDDIDAYPPFFWK